jgi:hypothetical protein
LELAVEGLSHGQSPLRIHRPPCPHTPTAPLTAPWPSHLLFSPAPSPRDHPPCPPITCIVFPHRASAPPLAVLPSHEHEQVCTSTVVYGKSRVVHVAAARGASSEAWWWFWEERTPTHWQWRISPPYCVCVRCHRVHSWQQQGVWWQYTSALLDCRGRWEWQPSSLLTRGWASKLLCMLDPNHTDAHPLCDPPSTGHPPRFVVEACSEGPSHERMPTCVSTAHLHQPPYNQPLAQDGNQHSGVSSAHPRTRGRMSTRVMITPHLHSPRCPAYHLSEQSRAIFNPRSRGGTTRRVLRSRVTPHQSPRITHVRW